MPKIKSSVVTKPRTFELKEAGELFDKIEGFAGYGFNAAHSVTYSLISYQAMWLKTNYPVEFYAAALSLIKDEKLPAVLKDAADFGVSIRMPDINVSGRQFEILNDTMICIPFNRIKGISGNTTEAILAARLLGPFKDKADLTARVERRKCNIKHTELLDKVGAFSRIEPGQIASDHPDRIKDQRELIPGLVAQAVPIHRDMNVDRGAKIKLVQIVADYRAACKDDGVAVKPTVGKNAHFMVIADCPSRDEEKLGSMSYGSQFEWIGEALSESGLQRSDGYWTALIKRPKEGKQVSPAEITKYLPYLNSEIEITKPPVIVLLGSSVVRQFYPDFKGKASDSAGKVIYNAALDANVVIGFSPGEIHYDPDKQTAMNEVFQVVVGLLT
jgi:DNA polymerase-3 subunit alpha